MLRFESLDGDIVVQLRRTYEDVGVGESNLYRLDGFDLSDAGSTVCIEDADSLEYVNSHHNWNDVARGEHDGTTYELAMSLDDTSTSIDPIFTFSARHADGSAALEPIRLILTGSPAYCWSCPASMPVSISELMIHNESTLADEAGEYEPWIEIFNPSGGNVDLTGWTLSDDFTRRDKWTLPAVTLPRHELLIVFADGQVEQGALHANFRLTAESREIVLSMPNGVTDGGFLFEAPGSGKSLAYDWAAADYVLSSSPTPGVAPEE